MPDWAPLTIATFPSSFIARLRLCSLHGDDDLAGRLAREQCVHRVRRLLQRKGHRHVRLQLAFGIPSQHLVEIPACLAGIAPTPGTIEDTAHIAALEQREI